MTMSAENPKNTPEHEIESKTPEDIWKENPDFIYLNQTKEEIERMKPDTIVREFTDPESDINISNYFQSIIQSIYYHDEDYVIEKSGTGVCIRDIKQDKVVFFTDEPEEVSKLLEIKSKME